MWATQEISVFVTKEQQSAKVCWGGLEEFLAGMKRMLEIGFNVLWQSQGWKEKKLEGFYWLTSQFVSICSSAMLGHLKHGGHEHRSSVCFRPVLVAEHVANKVSEMRNAELRCLYSYCFPRGMGNVGNNLLLFPLLFLRMCRLTEQEHQRWLLSFFLSGCSHVWSHLEFPKKSLNPGQAWLQILTFPSH